jgi:predicted CXXCH cytochrome family protein
MRGATRKLVQPRFLRVIAAISLFGVVGLAAKAQIASAPKRSPDQAPAASCTTAECHQPIVQHRYLHNPTAADCSACHLLVGDPKDHKFAYPVKQEELCIKCHKLPVEKHSHAPVRDGKCLDCHDAHGSEHKAQLVADLNRDLCVKCHSATRDNKKFVHGPVAVGACATCHKWHSSDNPKLLIAEANDLCTTCHADMLKNDTSLHTHKAMDDGCVSCHDPHATDHKFQLVESSPKLCLQCHQDKFEHLSQPGMVVHGAVTDEGGCTTCHEPHQSKRSALQRTDELQSCMKCHDKPLKDANDRTIANMSDLLAKNPVKHGPIKDGHCTVCHDPHASPMFRLLPAAYPETFYAPYSDDLYQLCFGCHTQEMVTKQDGRGVTQFRNGEQNLHALHVNQEKGRTCRACHEVHASRRPSHIRESVPFGNSNWMLEINFEASEQGGSCSPGCHAPKEYARPKAILPKPKDRLDLPAGAAAPANTRDGETAPAPAQPTPGTASEDRSRAVP